LSDKPPSRITHDPYAPFRIPAFRRYAVGGILTRLGTRMQSVAVGWDVYQRTGEPLALGLVGLVQVIPAILLALPAGWLADTYDRRKVVLLSLLGMTLTSAGLVLQAALGADVWVVYALLAADAVVGTLGRPARSSLVPRIVPRELFPSAVAWNNSMFQLAGVLGPAVGGFVIAASISLAYGLAAASSLLFAFLLTRIPEAAGVADEGGGHATLSTLFDGIHYLRRTRVLLAIISLDMFAVLLGGAVYLLPVFAEDILSVGVKGLGYLHAAPAVGALLTALVVAHLPPLGKAGRALLLSVAGFGLATIIFGLSSNLYLSLAMLFLTGAFDQVSMVVRHTMVQLTTPDAMRGRVSAVNGVFVSASNELGGFESGLVAHWFGPIISVISGGVGTLIVVGVTAWGSPQLRRFGSLGEIRTKQ
jgi:MFS family permease